MGHLEGLVVRYENTDLSTSNSQLISESKNKPFHPTNKVFVVHGHDVETKESVARFLERLRLDPIILHEQPNSGRTIIEKFEAFSNVGFAVVLLTPDDVGASSTSPKELKPRARQNVILELGYFMGKLSRYRVCALHRRGIEIPSDYQGILYIEFDEAGAWKAKLAQELVEANYSIDLDALLRS
jgi:predicted nucleotide-binding protein